MDCWLIGVLVTVAAVIVVRAVARHFFGDERGD